MPRPKATSILTKSPVARPTASDEFHFELHRNRVSFVNLDGLLEAGQGRCPGPHSHVRPHRPHHLAGRSGGIIFPELHTGVARMPESTSSSSGRASASTSKVGKLSPSRNSGAKPTRPRGTRSPSTPVPSAGLPLAVRWSRSGSTPTASVSTAVFAPSSWPPTSASPVVPCPRA